MSVCIASIERRTPRDAAQSAAELCRLAISFNRLNGIACMSGLTERQEPRKQDLQTRIKAVLASARLILWPAPVNLDHKERPKGTDPRRQTGRFPC